MYGRFHIFRLQLMFEFAIVSYFKMTTLTVILTRHYSQNLLVMYDLAKVSWRKLLSPVKSSYRWKRRRCERRITTTYSCACITNHCLLCIIIILYNRDQRKTIPSGKPNTRPTTTLFSTKLIPSAAILTFLPLFYLIKCGTKQNRFEIIYVEFNH